MKFDLGLRARFLVNPEKNKIKVHEDYFVGISGTQITSVQPYSDNLKLESKEFKELDVILPGLINGHTHLPMNAFRGIADDLSFQDWLFKKIFPLESKNVNPDMVRIGTWSAMAECIRFGVTTVCDMYYFEDTVADVVDQAGLRGLIGESIVDAPVPDSKTNLQNPWTILEKMAERYKGHDRIVPAIAPHAPYSNSDATYKRVVEFAESENLPIVTHVAETKAEVKEQLKKFKKTPVKRLFDAGIMDQRAIFAHCVHLTSKDIALIKKTKTGCVHNPESNMKLHVGVCPVGELLENGIAIGIGTDSAVSNNNLNLWGEMDMACKLQILTEEDGKALPAEKVLFMATLGGARALGLEKITGSIEVGKRADVIALSLDYPHMQPAYNLVSLLVYATTGLEVTTTICNGRVLMENQVIKTVDMEKLKRELVNFQKNLL